MSEKIIASVLDKLADLLFANATERNKARRADRDTLAAIFQQIWKSTEEIHVLARGKSSTSEAYSDRVRELNQYILQNEVVIDREVYLLVNGYFSELQSFCKAVREHGTEEDQQLMYETGEFDGNAIRAVNDAYQRFSAARDNLLRHIRGRISELKDA